MKVKNELLSSFEWLQGQTYILYLDCLQIINKKQFVLKSIRWQQKLLLNSTKSISNIENNNLVNADIKDLKREVAKNQKILNSFISYYRETYGEEPNFTSHSTADGSRK